MDSRELVAEQIGDRLEEQSESDDKDATAEVAENNMAKQQEEQQDQPAAVEQPAIEQPAIVEEQQELELEQQQELEQEEEQLASSSSAAAAAVFVVQGAQALAALGGSLHSRQLLPLADQERHCQYLEEVTQLCVQICQELTRISLALGERQDALDRQDRQAADKFKRNDHEEQEPSER